MGRVFAYCQDLLHHVNLHLTKKAILPDTKGVRILYIEDSVEFREDVIQRYLGNYEVVTADDGSDGLVAWRLGSYQLVLLDYEMGGCDGPEVLKAIRADDPHIPIIAFSLDDVLNRRLVEQGATDCVPKRRACDLLSLIRSLSA